MKLYNSLTQRLENFIPQIEKEVTLYVCGITPYDTTHLGHAFLYMQFDALVRYFSHKGYKTNYTQNITDIDDDLLKRAKRDGRDWKELGDFWTEKFITDLKNLNIQMPTHYVKATGSIEKIIEMTKILVEKGFAYEVNGNVYFEISKFQPYGRLSGFSRDQMLQIAKERGGRVDDMNKRDPLDFILWLKSEPDEPSWDSPWSKGRPGWHIECSAMVNEFLGESIDIHGGGRDLIFPHHESEIAQSESYTGKAPYVGTWMHAAMVMYQGEKMSKSLGNMVMVSDLLKTYSPNTIRYMLLSHQYRKPWEFNYEEMEEAQRQVEEVEARFKKETEGTDARVGLEEFEKAMEDDFNTPRALAILAETKDINTASQMFSIFGFTTN